MSRGRPLVLAALLCAAALLQAQGFPGRSFPALPTQTYSLLLLSNEAAHKELGLDGAQKNKALELGRAGTARVLEVLRSGKKPDELAKEIEKDLAFLKPQQRKRLRELTWQRLAGIPAGPRVVAADDSAAAELKLTKQQREKLAGGSTLASVLTDEQNKALKALLGTPADPAVLQARPGGFPGRFASVPTVLQYLENAAVAAELKPTEKQKETFAALAKKWRDKVPSSTRFNPTEAEVKEARELAESIEKDARAALTPAQAKRLDQIVLHVQKNRLRAQRDLFTLAAVVHGLKLSDEQKKKLSEVRDQREKGMLDIFTRGGEPKDVLASVGKHNEETYKLLLAELTAEQKKALDGLFGKPFAGDVRTTSFLPARRPNFDFPSSRTARTPLHLFLAARRYLGSAELHKELGATEDQKKKLAALAADSPATAGADEKKLAVLAAATEKELAAALKPEQIKRLGQVVLQDYARSATSRRSLGRFIEVQKGLGLSKGQIATLTRGTARSAPALDGILSDDQLTKWKEMLGKPSEVRLLPATPAFTPRGASLPPDLSLLQNAGVAADLKLTAEQKEKLTGIAKTYQEAAAARGPGLGRAANQQKLKEAREAAADAVAKLLDAAQKKRLAELNLQQARLGGLYALLSKAEVVAGLKLTADQTTRIKAARDAGQALLTALSRESGPSRGGEAAPEMARARAAIQAEADRKMQSVLSMEQQEALKQLLGEPFKGTLPRPSPFGPSDGWRGRDGRGPRGGFGRGDRGTGGAPREGGGSGGRQRD